MMMERASNVGIGLGYYSVTSAVPTAITYVHRNTANYTSTALQTYGLPFVTGGWYAGLVLANLPSNFWGGSVQDNVFNGYGVVIRAYDCDPAALQTLMDWPPLIDDNRVYPRGLYLRNPQTTPARFHHVVTTNPAADTVITEAKYCDFGCRPTSFVCLVDPAFTPLSPGFGVFRFQSAQAAEDDCVISPRVIQIVQPTTESLVLHRETELMGPLNGVIDIQTNAPIFLHDMTIWHNDAFGTLTLTGYTSGLTLERVVLHGTPNAENAIALSPTGPVVINDLTTDGYVQDGVLLNYPMCVVQSQLTVDGLKVAYARGYAFKVVNVHTWRIRGVNAANCGCTSDEANCISIAPCEVAGSRMDASTVNGVNAGVTVAGSGYHCAAVFVDLSGVPNVGTLTSIPVNGLICAGAPVGFRVFGKTMTGTTFDPQAGIRPFSNFLCLGTAHDIVGAQSLTDETSIWNTPLLAAVLPLYCDKGCPFQFNLLLIAIVVAAAALLLLVPIFCYCGCFRLLWGKNQLGHQKIT
jgi:hypothetical protein